MTQGKLPSIYPQPSKTRTASLPCRDKKMDTRTASDVISRALKLRQTSCLLDWQTWKKLHVLCGLCSQPNQILVSACFKCNFQYHIFLPRLPSPREALWSCVSYKHPNVMLGCLHWVGRWAGVLFTSSQSSGKSTFPCKSIQEDYITVRHLCAFWRGSHAA